MPYAKWGARKAILNDLSPAATFIAYNQNQPINAAWFSKAAVDLLHQSEAEYDWAYRTEHTLNDSQQAFASGEDKTGTINYTVWSDVFVCPSCSRELVFTEVSKNSPKDSFVCPNCLRKLTKRECTRAQEIIYDDILKRTVSVAKQVPVLINYTFHGKKYEKSPDEKDMELVQKIAGMRIQAHIPVIELPIGYNTEQPRRSHGVNYMHQFYTKRNLYAISIIYKNLRKVEIPERHVLMFAFEQILMGMSKIARYVPSHYSQVNQYLSGTLYIASQVVEVTPRYILENKIKNLAKIFSLISASKRDFIISTGSATNLTLPDSSVDYIFTDPPFGANLNYSELSFLWESWYEVLTNNSSEAIINQIQKKGLTEYQALMSRCFQEYFRILKPNRWITVEFHNSQNSIWNAIQEAIFKAGFIVADVRTLDKKQGSFKQITTSSAVKQDLVISAYKPKDSLQVSVGCRGGLTIKIPDSK